jgi:hypothetical protein
MLYACVLINRQMFNDRATIGAQLLRTAQTAFPAPARPIRVGSNGWSPTWK